MAQKEKQIQIHFRHCPSRYTHTEASFSPSPSFSHTQSLQLLARSSIRIKTQKRIFPPLFFCTFSLLSPKYIIFKYICICKELSHIRRRITSNNKGGNPAISPPPSLSLSVFSRAKSPWFPFKRRHIHYIHQHTLLPLNHEMKESSALRQKCARDLERLLRRRKGRKQTSCGDDSYTHKSFLQPLQRIASTQGYLHRCRRPVLYILYISTHTKA